MFETAEVGRSLSKARYKSLEPKLRLELLRAQQRLAGSYTALIVLVGGVEGAGKGEFANRLLTWLDPRGVQIHAFDEPTDEERERPYFWRFWRLLPERRRAAVFLSSWYTRPIVNRVFKEISQAQLDQDLDRIADFERMLSRENVLVVKLWFHIDKKSQKRRFEELEGDAATRWRVSPLDWRFHKKYERFEKVCAHALMKTSTGESPWSIVEAHDRRYRDITAGRVVLDALEKRLADARPRADPKPDRPKPEPQNVLRKLDLGRKLAAAPYKKRIEELQGRLGALTLGLRRERRSLMLVFEGPDAAGKGGAIRRLTEGIEARLYRVDSVCAPTDEERAHPYLWRFWRVLPRQGRVTICDRSWYGRVLVERIEGFAARGEWSRAFSEINAFEEQLSDAGTIVQKFWLAISSEEQLRRFKSRERTPYKQYKITEEDWRNRSRWDAYEAAACEMFERTSTDYAPWTLIEAEDKRWARVRVLETVVERLEAELA